MQNSDKDQPKLTSANNRKQRILYVCLAFLLVWTLFFFSYPNATSLKISSSFYDFLINQKYIDLKIGADIEAIRKTFKGYKGLKEMAESDIAFVGAGKNIADHLPLVLKQIEAISPLFKSSHAVFVESDSTDDTKRILMHWASKSTKNRTIILVYNQTREVENIAQFKGNPLPREGRIAEARNKALAYVRDNLPPTKYILVIDLDQIGFEIEGVIDSFSYSNWDVMCAHGTLLHGLFRDSYAFRIPGINTNHHRCGDDYRKYNLTLNQKKAYRKDTQTSKAKVSQIMGTAYSNAIRSKLAKSRLDFSPASTITLKDREKESNFKIAKMDSENVLVEVDSCFGGLGIYRTDAMQNCMYQYRHDEFPYFQDCEHVLLHECMKKKSNATILSNPLMKLWYGHNPITQQNIEKLLRNGFSH